MERAAMKKAVRLEFNNAGAWKVLGLFDAADADWCDAVMDAAEDLIQALHNGRPDRRCPTLRISIDAVTVLARWDLDNGWRDVVTGEPL